MRQGKHPAAFRSESLGNREFSQWQSSALELENLANKYRQARNLSLSSVALQYRYQSTSEYLFRLLLVQNQDQSHS